MNDLEPLSPSARALLDEERARHTDESVLQARVRERLSAALGRAFLPDLAASPVNDVPPDLPSTPGLVALTRAKLLGLVAASALSGAVVGGAVVGGLTHKRPATEQVIPVQLPPQALPQVSDAAIEGESIAPEPPPLAPAPTVEHRNAPRKVDLPSTQLAAERALIDAARAASRSGNSAEALDAIERHLAAFPRGVLAEEREGIRILTLVRAGRVDEAQAHATRFRATYPESLFLQQIERALSDVPKP